MAGKAVPEITVDGRPFGPLTSLTLDQPWNDHHSFKIVCPFREQPDSLMSLGRDYVGKPITIKLMSGIREGRGELTFVGLVTNVRVTKHEDAVMQLVLEGFSPTRTLDDGPHNQTFTEQSLDAIVKTVVNGFPGVVAKYALKHATPLPYITQYKESAYRFLSRLLSTYGEWCYYDGEEVIFGAPPAGEEIALTFGKDMTGLDVSANVVPANFKLLGYDYIGDKHYESTAASAKVTELDDLTRMMVATATEVFAHEPTFVEPFRATDKGQLDQHALRRRSGQSTSLINLFGESSRLDLRIGQIVTVRALGHTLGVGLHAGGADYGSFRLLHLTHHCDGSGNYTNTFQGIPAKLAMPPVQDRYIHPPIAEPQLAEVLDNHDPEQLGRVQVQFPWQKPTGEHTPWLRVAAAGAGGSHGAYFVPEIGDQVMVNFAYNNPDRPYVTGSLYHGKVKPANAADPDNNSKIIRTRSGNQIVLSDKGGEESIRIENGSNVITLNLAGDTTIDVVTTGTLNMNAKEINLTASENLNVTVGGSSVFSVDKDATFTAVDGITIDGGKKIDTVATDITIAADAGFSASGGATTDVTSPNTTVKGDAMVTVTAPMVKLN